MAARFLILALWLALVAAGLWAAPRLAWRLGTAGAPPPGSDSARVASVLREELPDLAGESHLAVITGDDGTYTRRLAGRLHARQLSLGSGVRAVWIAGVPRAGGPARVAELRRRIAESRPPAGVTVALTGPSEAVADLYAFLSDRLATIERVSLGAALLVLVAVIRSLPLALLGLSVGAACLLAAPAAIYLISLCKPISSLDLAVAAVVSLAMGLDYPLLFLARWRETGDIAVTRRTAGRTIAATAAILAGAGLSLLLVPLPEIHAIGLTLAATAILALASALTLLPALLALLPRAAPAGITSPIWSPLLGRVLARPRTAAALSLGALALLASPLVAIRTWSPSYAVLPPHVEAARAIRTLEAAGVAGAVGPVIVAWDRDADRAGILGELRQDPRVGRIWHAGRRLTLMESRKPPDHPDSGHLVRAIRAAVGAAGMVGGAAAGQADVEAAILHSLPAVAGANLLIIFLVLGLHLGSVFLPLKAVITNLLPVLAGLGTVVAVFQPGNGHVQTMTVLIMLSLLMAISMDYEIFILSRVREAHDAGEGHLAAISAGMLPAGRVVVGAALVLLAVFVPYCFVEAPGLQELGVGLSASILVDATLVRLVLVPATLALLADWNWWHPFQR